MIIKNFERKLPNGLVAFGNMMNSVCMEVKWETCKKNPTVFFAISTKFKVKVSIIAVVEGYKNFDRFVCNVKVKNFFFELFHMHGLRKWFDGRKNEKWTEFSTLNMVRSAKRFF